MPTVYFYFRANLLPRPRFLFELSAPLSSPTPMATELLSTRQFRRRRSPEEEDGPPSDSLFRSLALEAHGSHPRTRPSPEKPIHIIVDVVQQDSLRIVESESSAEEGMEDETFSRRFGFLVPPHHLADPSMWEEEVLWMLMNFNLFPESHRRVRQELPAFLREMAREARERGFGALRMVCTVEQMFTVRYSFGEDLSAGSDDGAEGERLFLAAMADGKIRSVLSKKEEACTVCLDGFLEGSEMCELCCSHVFHSDCIRRWFQESIRLRQGCRCPVCRCLLYP